MQAILDGGSSYCGPTSLSAISGVGTKTITRMIQETRRNTRKVTGIAVIEAMAMMKKLKIKNELIYNKAVSKSKYNLASWVAKNGKSGVTYLVVVTGHMLVVRDRRVVCTQWKGMEGNLAESKSLFKMVKFVWKIENSNESQKIATELSGNPVATFETAMGSVSFFGGKI